jgi:predicted ATPase
MVKEIRIQNYKSVQDLTLELGRINVLIGANGCGKSNILEAIAFGSAAAEDKLGNEFLSARGIRVTEPVYMRSGFNKLNSFEAILLKLVFNTDEYLFEINNKNEAFSDWQRMVITPTDENSMSNDFKKFSEIINNSGLINNKLSEEEKNKIIEKLSNQVKPITDVINYKFNERKDFANFIIYAPENTFLRKFEEESQIEPLGIRGEGLFKLLSVMNQETPEEFQEIIENLELIDWFEGFEIPKDLVFTERRIRIKDRFLEEGLQYFDQRSSNEGFLFLMFYFALFISKYTPKFFAIDNIDASLNPKLCIELIKILTKLAKKHDKQVIFTTHNPAILDGLNLNDDEVRLLVVNRNIHGHTNVKRVLKKEMPEGVEPLRLSEQFLRGYLGGLPKNF